MQARVGRAETDAQTDSNSPRQLNERERERYLKIMRERPTILFTRQTDRDTKGKDETQAT